MRRPAYTVLLVAAFTLLLDLPVEAASKKYCFFEMESMCPGRQPPRGSKIRKPKPKAKVAAPVPAPKPVAVKVKIPVPKPKPAHAAALAATDADAAPKVETIKTPESAPATPEPKPETVKTPESPPPEPEPKPETAQATEPTPPAPEPKPEIAQSAEPAPPEPAPKPDVAETPEPEPPEPQPKPDVAQAPEPAPPAPEPKPTITEPTPPAAGGPERAAAEAGAVCRAELGKLGVTFTQPVARDYAPCNIDNAVQLDSIKAEGQTVNFIGKPIFNCTFAKQFSTWVADVAIPVVQSQEDKALAALSTGPGFECRNRNGDTTSKISEHASGNAVDIDTIVLADKARIAISQVANPNDPHYRMLMALRTSGCGYFTTVLGPGSNAAHASHYHFDLGVHGKSGNYRICE